MTYKLIKGNQSTFESQIQKYKEADIIAFDTSDDASKFTALIWTDGDPVLGDVKEVIKEVEVDNPKLVKEIKKLTKENEKLKEQEAEYVEEIDGLVASLADSQDKVQKLGEKLAAEKEKYRNDIGDLKKQVKKLKTALVEE